MGSGGSTEYSEKSLVVILPKAVNSGEELKEVLAPYLDRHFMESVSGVTVPNIIALNRDKNQKLKFVKRKKV